jgi:hypothetical protein
MLDGTVIEDEKAEWHRVLSGGALRFAPFDPFLTCDLVVLKPSIRANDFEC